MQQQKLGFTLIEIMIGMLIVSTVMISAFQVLSSVGIAKVKLIEQTEIEKRAYFASERFFEMIKKGGTIDYEEYWNRYNYSTGSTNQHFTDTSGFGNFGKNGTTQSTNFGEGIYYCLSKNLVGMGTGGCLSDFNSDINGNNNNKSYSGSAQRYTQYSLQFIDRNSDKDNDKGNEDGTGSILNDDDDLFLGIGPAAFPDNKVGELYLINSEGNERTYFRWNVKRDADSVSLPCSGGESMTGSGCLGTIEFLKLTGKDYGYDHNFSTVDSDGSQSDGVIDTWYIHDDFNPGGDVVAGSNDINYWQPIFPESTNVKDVEFYVYPNKSLEYSWRDTDPSIFIAPYIQIKMTLEPSIKIKKKIKGQPPVVNIATTIQLSSLDLK